MPGGCCFIRRGSRAKAYEFSISAGRLLMFLLAHTGITLGAAYAVDKAVNCRPAGGPAAHGLAACRVGRGPLSIDYRFIMLGALLPDIIDKPLGLILLPGLGNGRIFLHTLLFLLFALLAAFIIYRQQRGLWGFYLAFGVVMHFLMDAIWNDHVSFYWPFLGPFLAYPGTTFILALQRWLQTLTNVPGVYLPEIAGFIILLWFALKLIVKKRVTAFVLKGSL
jgi:inner membrane protein